MKITGGKARGIRIDTPDGDRTRPTTDRIRESVFAILRQLVPEARVLDLFAGSGALGLEAASRGAAEVHAVEEHPGTATLIRRNAERLPPAGVSVRFQVYALDVFSWLQRGPPTPYDLVFADPPYEKLQTAEDFKGLLSALALKSWMVEEGLLILECSGRFREEAPEGWALLRRENYGSSSILFLERVMDSPSEAETETDSGISS